jgi:intraflagellar transport protein 56
MNTFVKNDKKAHFKAKSSEEASEKKAEAEKKKPKLSTFIRHRDYTGAIVFLEYKIKTGTSDEHTLAWLAYSAFHLGDYQKAADTYDKILKSKNADPVNHHYKAACLFYMRQYYKAEKEAMKGPETSLQHRILFHVSHRVNDNTKLMKFHKQVGDAPEDQLSLAAIHYLRSHFQDATDIYKRLLMDRWGHIRLCLCVFVCAYICVYNCVCV